MVEGGVDRAFRGRSGLAEQGGASTTPILTSAPTSFNFLAEASERASPVTLWPAAISSFTTLNPMKPVAPVTKTRISFWLRLV